MVPGVLLCPRPHRITLNPLHQEGKSRIQTATAITVDTILRLHATLLSYTLSYCQCLELRLPYTYHFSALDRPIPSLCCTGHTAEASQLATLSAEGK